MRVRLLLQEGDRDRTVEIAEFPALIGRQSDCVLRIEDPRASRRHASLEVREGRLFLRDLGSGNGTQVNGLRASICALGSGDEIRIGEILLRIESISVKKDEQPKSGKRAVSREAAERSLRRRRLVSILGPPAALLVVGGVVALLLIPREPGPPAPEAPLVLLREEADREYHSLREATARAARITPGILEQVEAARKKFVALTPPGAEDRFADLRLELRYRQKLEVSNRLLAARSRAVAMLARNEYGAAEKHIREEVAALSRDVPSLVHLSEGLVSEMRMAIGRAFVKVEGDMSFLEQLRREEDALRICEKAVARFAGTRHEEVLRARGRALAEKLEEDREKLRQAIERIAKATEPEAARGTEKVEPRTSGLSALLSGPVRDGALSEKTYSFGEVRGNPVDLTGDLELVIRGKEGRQSIPFPSVPAPVQIQMAEDALVGDALVLAARFGYRKGLAAAAEKLLWIYVREKGAPSEERQARVDRILAAARALNRVPEGGFEYSTEHGWESEREKAGREALALASRLGRTLAGVSNLRGLKGYFGKMEALLSDKGLATSTRARVREIAIDALDELRSRQADRLAARVKKMGFAHLRAAREELDKRRKAALDVIFDTAVYLPENHPDYPKGDVVNGQEAVDKAVASVRELWDNAASYSVTMDSAATKLAEMMEEIDKVCSEKLRHRPDGKGSSSLDEIVNNLATKIDLRRYAVSRSDAERFQYNRKVEEYNRSLEDPELPEGDKAHVAYLNDYREMLGLNRLIMDLRLCRATRKHSAACNAAGRIWHNGPDGSPSSRAKEEGFPGGVAENVAIGYSNPKDIWTRGWYRASDHHRNAVGRGHNCIGYGYAGNVGTQNFSRSGVPFQ